MKKPLSFLRKMGTCFIVVRKIRENALDKVNHDLRLASREPRKGVLNELPCCCFKTLTLLHLLGPKLLYCNRYMEIRVLDKFQEGV